MGLTPQFAHSIFKPPQIDTSPVVAPLAGVADASKITVPKISDFTSPDFSKLPGLPTNSDNKKSDANVKQNPPLPPSNNTNTNANPDEISYKDWWRLDKTIPHAASQLVNAASTAKNKIVNVEMRGVIIIGAIAIIILGLYFLIKDKVDISKIPIPIE